MLGVEALALVFSMLPECQGLRMNKGTIFWLLTSTILILGVYIGVPLYEKQLSSVTLEALG